MSAVWQRYDPAARRLTLTLHIQPGARSTAFAGTHGDALKVRIAAPAVDNQANAALIEFLGEMLAIPKSAIAIRRGATARRKIVDIACGPELTKMLVQLVED